MDTLLPTVEVWLSGKPLSYFGLDAFLKHVTCERTIDKTASTQKNPKGKSHRQRCSLTFENLDGQLLSSMAVGERVELWMGFQPERYFRGAFIVTRPMFGFSESSSLEITLEGEDESAGMVNNTPTRLFSGSTVGAVVKAVAAVYGLDTQVDPAVAAMPVRESVKTARESDWDYLQRVVHGSSAGMMYVEPAPPGEGKRSKLVIRPLTGELLLNVAPRRTTEIVSIGYRVDADYWFKSAGVDLDVTGAAHLGGGSMAPTGAQNVVPLPNVKENVPWGAYDEGGVSVNQLVDGATAQQHPAVSAVARAQGASLNALQGYIADAAASEALAIKTINGLVGAVDVAALPGVQFLRDFGNSVELWNAMKVRIRTELNPALPFLYPGHIIDGRGLGPFSGRLLAVSIRDEWGDGGYTQAVVWKSGRVVPTKEQTADGGASWSVVPLPNAKENVPWGVPAGDGEALDEADPY